MSYLKLLTIKMGNTTGRNHLISLDERNHECVFLPDFE